MDSARPSHRVVLGTFLRSRRERLLPDQPHVARAVRRRTPGLRREEVAEAVGISVEWYARLEQGRVTPSERIVCELARVLRFEPDEREHVLRLVKDVPRGPYVCADVPTVVRSIVAALNQPAYVIDRRWDVLAWNDSATDLFVDYAAAAVADRNVLIYMMTDPAARALFGAAWSSEARRIIAHFREDFDVWFDDPGFLELERRLLQSSPEFVAFWREREVRRPTSSSLDVSHRVRGPLRVEYSTFESTEHPDLRLVIHSFVSDSYPSACARRSDEGRGEDQRARLAACAIARTASGRYAAN